MFVCKLFPSFIYLTSLMTVMFSLTSAFCMGLLTEVDTNHCGQAGFVLLL